MDNLAMEIITATSNELFFRSLLVAMLFVLQMAIGRPLGKVTVILLFLLTIPLGILAADYHSFAVSVGERSTLSFYTDFLNHWSRFYFSLVLVFLGSLVVLRFKVFAGEKLTKN